MYECIVTLRKKAQIANSLLVMRERQRPDTGVTGRVGVQQRQVEGAPDLHDAAVAARDQVFAVA